MGFRYWTTVGKRTARRDGPGLNPGRRQGQEFEPDAPFPDDRLALATAVPLWGIFSMLGWLVIAYAALNLAQVNPRLRSADAWPVSGEAAVAPVLAFAPATPYVGR